MKKKKKESRFHPYVREWLRLPENKNINKEEFVCIIAGYLCSEVSFKMFEDFYTECVEMAEAEEN
jgi:hypothetical protein